MHRLRHFILVFSFALALCPAPAFTEATGLPFKLYTIKGDFDTVREDIEIAIANRGLVVDHTSHIADMLERTGKDIGATKKIFGKALSLQFCSAAISRRMMEADPRNIIFCPYIVILYTLPANPKTVYAGYRRPPIVGTAESKASLKAVEAMLDGIVREALNLK